MYLTDGLGLYHVVTVNEKAMRVVLEDACCPDCLLDMSINDLLDGGFTLVRDGSDQPTV